MVLKMKNIGDKKIHTDGLCYRYTSKTSLPPEGHASDERKEIRHTNQEAHTPPPVVGHFIWVAYIKNVKKTRGRPWGEVYFEK